MAISNKNLNFHQQQDEIIVFCWVYLRHGRICTNFHMLGLSTVRRSSNGNYVACTYVKTRIKLHQVIISCEVVSCQATIRYHVVVSCQDVVNFQAHVSYQVVVSYRAIVSYPVAISC